MILMNAMHDFMFFNLNNKKFLSFLNFQKFEKLGMLQMVDLDLLSCFPKFGQESSKRIGGIELSKCLAMEEREQEKGLGKKLGKKPFL